MATNFDVKKGYTFKRTGTYKNKKTGLPIDLSNYTISGEIKKGTLVVPFEVTMLDAVAGQFRIRLGEEVTSTLAATTYEMIVRIEDPDGDTRPWFEGVMKVLP